MKHGFQTRTREAEKALARLLDDLWDYLTAVNRRAGVGQFPLTVEGDYTH